MHRITSKSPIGDLAVFASDDAITCLWFGHRIPEGLADVPESPTPLLDNAATQLTEYFARERTAFDLPLAPEGTEFQRSVWNALLTIPHGQTASYKDIADQIDNPKAVRAVGLANGKNPISIIIPCHRVIGANGTLTGYGGGLDIKHQLLTHEGIQLL